MKNSETVSNGTSNEGRIVPLEELDRKFSFVDVKTKFMMRAEGERAFSDKSNKRIEYGVLNGVVIKGPAKYNEMDKTYSMDIPVLVFGRFLDWLQLPENAQYFNDLIDAEIKKTTGIRHIEARQA